MTRLNVTANRSIFTVILVFIAVFSTGCAALQVPELNLPASPFRRPPTPTYTGVEPGFELQPEAGEQIYNGVREAKARNAVVLHVVGDSTPVRVLPLPASGQSVTVSQLLTQTKVTKKLGSIDATLFRPSTDSISGMPLDIKMGKDGHSVRPETDYALRAGDRLRVRKAISPAIGGLIETILGL
jgi:hypothetical protein